MWSNQRPSTGRLAGMGAVKCGVGLGVRTSVPDGPTYGHLVDLLERLGFDSLWISERATSGSLEPLSALAFAAGRTTRLKLGTSTLVVPGRNPVLLARELAAIDALSGGRFLPAFGLGVADDREHQAFGVQRRERAGWFDEAVPLIRRLWREPSVTHAGPRFTVSDLSISPKPVGRMQIWIGGRTPREYDRAGRLAEGWLGSFQTPDEAAQAREQIEQATRQHGRSIDDDHYGMVVIYSRAAASPAVTAMAARMRPDLPLADLIPAGPDELLARLRRYVTLGITKFVLVMPETPDSWDEELTWLAPLVHEVESAA
jgi:probable F420-dependent oxidoreductase